MTNDRYVSLTEIGKIVGGTSHSVGKTLTAAGLRVDGTPSKKAFSLNLVTQAPTGRGLGYFYKWHLGRVMPFLRKGQADDAR